MTLLASSQEFTAAQRRRQLEPLLVRGREPGWTKTWQILLHPPVATRYRGFGAPRATASSTSVRTPLA